MIQLHERINVQRVLNAEEYWNPPRGPDSSWLYDEVFPAVRMMLTEHGGHKLVLWEINDKPNEWWLDWLEIGWSPYPTGRYLAQAANVQNWDQALAYFDAPLVPRPWRTNDDAAKERFRKAFERHRARARA